MGRQAVGRIGGGVMIYYGNENFGAFGAMPGEPIVRIKRLAWAMTEGKPLERRMLVEDYSRRWSKWATEAPMEWVAFALKRDLGGLKVEDVKIYREAWKIPEVEEIWRWEGEGGSSGHPHVSDVE